MSLTPQVLRALKDIGAFEITWSDGTSFRLPFKFVRSECPCAECVHEITGERIIQPEWIPDDIQPTELSYAGNYFLSSSYDTFIPPAYTVKATIGVPGGKMRPMSTYAAQCAKPRLS